MSLVRSRRRPTFLVRSQNNAVSIQVQEAGSAVTPSAATYTLRAPDGTAVVDADPAVAGSTSTYTISADLTSYAYSSLWQEEWALTIGGVVFYFGGQVILSRVGEPAAPITEDDLKEAFSDLSRATMLPQGKTSFQPYIDMAMDDVVRRLLVGTMHPHMVVDWSAFAGYVTERAAFYLFRDAALSGGTTWLNARDDAKAAAEDEWKALGFQVDRDQDGATDTAGEVMGSADSYAVGLMGRRF